MGKTARQNKQEFINPTESEQDSDTQIHKPSFRLISSLENTERMIACSPKKNWFTVSVLPRYLTVANITGHGVWACI